jgi:hypothetical protein
MFSDFEAAIAPFDSSDRHLEKNRTLFPIGFTGQSAFEAKPSQSLKRIALRDRIDKETIEISLVLGDTRQPVSQISSQILNIPGGILRT